MFCNNCGKEISDKASVCVGCGISIKNKPINKNKLDTILSLISSVFIVFAILSIAIHLLTQQGIEVQSRVIESATEKLGFWVNTYAYLWNNYAWIWIGIGSSIAFFINEIIRFVIKFRNT